MFRYRISLPAYWEHKTYFMQHIKKTFNFEAWLEHSLLKTGGT